VEKLEARRFALELARLSDKELMALGREVFARFIENPAEIEKLDPGEREQVRGFVESCALHGKQKPEEDRDSE
jgi:hypothetical protein